VRLWKDLENLKRGWQNSVPVGAISGKKVNGPMTRFRLLRSQNRWLIAGLFAKPTL